MPACAGLTSTPRPINARSRRRSGSTAASNGSCAGRDRPRPATRADRRRHRAMPARVRRGRRARRRTTRRLGSPSRPAAAASSSSASNEISASAASGGGGFDALQQPVQCRQARARTRPRRSSARGRQQSGPGHASGTPSIAADQRRRPPAGAEMPICKSSSCCQRSASRPPLRSSARHTGQVRHRPSQTTPAAPGSGRSPRPSCRYSRKPANGQAISNAVSAKPAPHNSSQRRVRREPAGLVESGGGTAALPPRHRQRQRRLRQPCAKPGNDAAETGQRGQKRPERRRNRPAVRLNSGIGAPVEHIRLDHGAGTGYGSRVPPGSRAPPPRPRAPACARASAPPPARSAAAPAGCATVPATRERVAFGEIDEGIVLALGFCRRRRASGARREP